MKEKVSKFPENPFPARPCIPAENLSAELDGEYHFSPEERDHLAHCNRCRSLYESYRVIDDAVSRSLTVNCPSAAAARIRKQVNRRLDSLAPMQAHGPIRFSALAARVAAVLVIAVMVGYLILIDNPYSGELEKPVRPLPAASQEVRPEPSSSDPAGLSASVDVRRLQLTAAGSDSVRFMDPASAPVKADHIAVIPPEVKQVWIYEPSWKDGRLEKLFRTVLELSGIPLKNVRIEWTGSSVLRAGMNLNRRQAAVLNRQLAGAGLQLISSVQPQPEQKLFAGTGLEAVAYEAVFIPRGK